MSACARSRVRISSMVEVARWPNPPSEVLGIITELLQRLFTWVQVRFVFSFILWLLHSLLHHVCVCVCFSNLSASGRVRWWCFITLTEAEWYYITKYLLNGWGLSIITAAAFMFSLALTSLSLPPLAFRSISKETLVLWRLQIQTCVMQITPLMHTHYTHTDTHIIQDLIWSISIGFLYASSTHASGFTSNSGVANWALTSYL